MRSLGAGGSLEVLLEEERSSDLGHSNDCTSIKLGGMLELMVSVFNL